MLSLSLTLEGSCFFCFVYCKKFFMLPTIDAVYTYPFPNSQIKVRGTFGGGASSPKTSISQWLRYSGVVTKLNRGVNCLSSDRLDCVYITLYKRGC